MPRDDGAAIGKRAQGVHARQLDAGQRQPNGFGAGREQQSIELERAAIGKRDLSRSRIDRGGRRAKPQIDLLFRLEAVVA